MTWRVVAASATGSSHVTTGEPCQDECWAFVEDTPGAPSTLTVFVADGAGSALRGGDGAKIAIEAAAAFINTKFSQPEFALSDDFAVQCVDAVRDRLFKQADRDGLSARDFACTFLGVVSSDQGTLVLQIGDGGVVLDVGTGLQVAVEPMSGEYANMTHFVTDEDAIDVVVTKTYDQKATRVAAFTDGVQRLALNMASNTPHEPFFAPFFKTLATSTPEQRDALETSLRAFLGSAAVNERTDDDKTLVLAVFAS